MNIKTRLLIATSVAAAAAIAAPAVSAPILNTSAVKQAQQSWGVKEWEASQSRDERLTVKADPRAGKVAAADREDRDMSLDNLQKSMSAAQIQQAMNPKIRDVTSAQEDQDANSRNMHRNIHAALQARGYGTKDYEESHARDDADGPKLANGGFVAMAEALKSQKAAPAKSSANQATAKQVHATVERDDADIGRIGRENMKKPGMK